MPATPIASSRFIARFAAFIVFIALAALLAAWPDARAAATQIRCPATLVQAPRDIPSEWSLRGAPAELVLQRAAFYAGDPAGLDTLAPDSTHRAAGTETSTWHFDDGTGVWIGCLYRDGTAVVARPLPPGLHRCMTRMRVTTMGDPAGLLSVTCE